MNAEGGNSLHCIGSNRAEFMGGCGLVLPWKPLSVETERRASKLGLIGGVKGRGWEESGFDDFREGGLLVYSWVGGTGGWGLDEILFDWFSSDNGRSGLSDLVSKEGVVKYDGRRGTGL